MTAGEWGKESHTPRMRGIQYAAASRFHHWRLGILDHPHSRVMTRGGLSQRFSRFKCQTATTVPTPSLRAKRSNPLRRAKKEWIASSLSLLAMTLEYDSAFPRRSAPELCLHFSPLKSEGAGNAGCPLHPQPPVQQKSTGVEATGTPEITRHSPRNGFNGFLRALPGDRACLPPSPRGNHPAKLDASVGASGPHDFAVRVTRCTSAAPTHAGIDPDSNQREVAETTGLRQP